MKQENIILAIDPSTKSTGWAIFKEKKLISYGVIVAEDKNVHKRIKKVIVEINKVIELYHPNEVILEDVIPSDVKNNNNVFKALMYLQGAIVSLLEEKNIYNYNFYVASHWRKMCNIKTGQNIRREELKKESINFVKNNYNIEVNDDIADAICIGYTKIQEKDKPYTVNGFNFK